MAVGKKLRFEIFKRDRFECQYCGAHPPAAILHVDHIHPSAEGGSDDASNLVTACEACNLGKGARLLSNVPMSLAARAEAIAEREEQLRGYQEIVRSHLARKGADLKAVFDEFEYYFPRSTRADNETTSIMRFIDKLGIHEVIGAMRAAGERWPDNDDRAFRYFCGICWNKIREGSS